MTDELYFVCSEYALVRIQCDTLLSEPLEHLPQVLYIFILRSSIYQYIVNVYLATIVDKTWQHFLGHRPLEIVGCGLDAHRYTIPLEDSHERDESRHPS